MTLDELKKLLISLDKVKYDHKFAKNISTYYNCSVSKDKTSSNMFALIYDDRVPLKISLRCDPQLAKILREKYVEVMPASKLNNKIWNTILISGQLTKEDIIGLIRLSYDLALGSQKTLSQ